MSKQHKVDRKNETSILSWLSDGNGAARTYTLTTYEEVEDAANEVKEKISEILPQSAQTGVRATFTGAGPWAGAYRYTAITTRLHFVRRASGIFLADVERVSVFPKTGTRVEVFLQPEHRDAAIAHFSARLAREFKVETPSD